MEGTGNSGKSTLVSILTLLIGDDNWGPLRTKLLNDRFELGHLMDKTLLIANEVGADFLGSTSATTLKALVGGGRMGGEIKFGGMSTKVAQYVSIRQLKAIHESTHPARMHSEAARELRS